MGLTTDFPLVEKGYDPSEVDQYLATQMLQLREQVDSAAIRISELEDELEAARGREDAIQLTMVAATKARDELIERAKADADEIISESRREAFLVVTEARKDADLAISEGETMLEEARSEALTVVTAAEEETKRLIAQRKEVLDKLRAQYESESATMIDRINTLRAISDDMTAKTTSATPEPTPQDPPPRNEGRTANAPQAKNVPDRDDDGETPIADKIRGSFSGRRSAKLPRIGEEAGRNALAAATAMRAHLSHEPDESSNTDPADLAVRTA